MLLNYGAKHWTCDDPVDPEVLPFHQRLPDYAETPLHRLPAEFCNQLGVHEIYVKDESDRCSLPAFKILGASWGAHRAIVNHLDCPMRTPLGDLRSLAHEADICLYTATDGNHGRAVARIANILGVRAFIYVPTVMLQKTRESIRQEGAFVITVNGDYDDAVREAEKQSEGASGILVQDTSWPGYEEIPKWIVQGYSTMMIEIDQQMKLVSRNGPDLVVVPIGVGSLAHAVIAHYKQKGRGTTILAVEPETAACLKTSLEHEKITAISTTDTSMCGMNCGTVSYTAWPYLCSGIDACITVTDAEAEYAQGVLEEHDVNVGPCGAATLAALRKACEHHKDELHLSEEPIIVLLATEGPR